MTWADFYLICFAVGFAFSLISFLGGGSRWRLHLPHLPHGGAHVPMPGQGMAGHGIGGHAPVAGHGHVATGAAQGAVGKGPMRTTLDTSISPFNFVTFTAFLAWFGGTGYLLTRYSTVWFVMGLGIAITSGPLGGSCFTEAGRGGYQARIAPSLRTSPTV